MKDQLPAKNIDDHFTLFRQRHLTERQNLKDKKGFFSKILLIFYALTYSRILIKLSSEKINHFPCILHVLGTSVKIEKEIQYCR